MESRLAIYFQNRKLYKNSELIDNTLELLHYDLKTVFLFQWMIKIFAIVN